MRLTNERAAPAKSGSGSQNAQLGCTSERKSNLSGGDEQAPVAIARLTKNKRETLHIDLATFKGYRLLGLRVWADGDKGPVPTRSGLNLRVEMLDALIEALGDAKRQARVLGWIAP